MAKAKFPKVLHVTREEEGGSHYLVPHEDGICGIDADQPVAIYKLVSTGRVLVNRSFKDAKQK